MCGRNGQFEERENMKRILSLGIALVATALGQNVLAGPFTAGNLVIYRVGDGTSLLTNRGNRVFLDEYRPLTNSLGVVTNLDLIQSVMLPTNYFGANSPLIAVGTAFGNGLITRSVDGRFILVCGYGATLGQFTNFSLQSATSIEAPRVVGLVDGNGNIDTTTTQTNFFSSEEMRSAASTDGTNIWLSGSGDNQGGVRYTTRGSGDSTRLSSFATNLRQLNISSNKLYLSAQTGATRLALLTNDTSNIPTTTNNVFIANLSGITSSNLTSPWAFVLFKLKAGGSDPLDTLYVADATAGAVLKFSLVGTNWVNNGSILAFGAVGLAGRMRIDGSTTNVDLFITGGGSVGSGSDNLYTFIDSTGYNGDPSGDANGNIPTTSGSNKRFLGLVFAPVGGETFPSGPGQISVGPKFGLFANGFPGCSVLQTQTYSIANVGTVSVTWSATQDVNWVTVTPASGSLASGGSVTVSAFFNANVNSLSVGTNTATITFTNTTSAPNNLGTTTRAVRLILNDQTITPTTDFSPAGDVGSYTPSNRAYTVTTGPAITLVVSKTASWMNLNGAAVNAATVSLGACSSAIITVSVNVANANALTHGFYGDDIVFSNVTASTVIGTRNATLSKGFTFWSDDFSTFEEGALLGQKGWLLNNAGSGGATLTVQGGAVVLPPDQSTIGEWLFKNFPLTGGCGSNALPNIPVFAGMLVKPTKVSATNAVYFATFFNFNNGSLGGGTSGCAIGAPNGFTTFQLAVQSLDAGFTNFVLAARTSQQGGTPYFRSTTSWPIGTTLRVVMMTDVNFTNTTVYVNPTSDNLGAQTPAVVASNTAGFTLDVDVGSFGLRNFGGATPTSGELVYKLSVSTNYADVYNFITSGAPPSDPFTTWQSQYFGCTGCAQAQGGADPDGDGMSNTNEFLAGFNPTNNAAYVHVISVAKTGSTNMTVTYLGASGNSTTTPPLASRTNVLEFTTGTGNGSYTSTNFVSANQTNVLSGGTGLGAVSSFVHTNGATGATRYYRIRVLVP